MNQLRALPLLHIAAHIRIVSMTTVSDFSITFMIYYNLLHTDNVTGSPRNKGSDYLVIIGGILIS